MKAETQEQYGTILISIAGMPQESISPSEAIFQGKELQRLGEEVKVKQEELKCVRTNWRWRCPYCGNHLEDSFETVLSKKEQHDKDLAAMEHLRKLEKKGIIQIGYWPVGKELLAWRGFQWLPANEKRDFADRILAIPIEEK